MRRELTDDRAARAAPLRSRACGSLRPSSKVYRDFEQHRQSPMKNLEVKISLFELEFHCKNLFLVWGKRWGARI